MEILLNLIGTMVRRIYFYTAGAVCIVYSKTITICHKHDLFSRNVLYCIHVIESDLIQSKHEKDRPIKTVFFFAPFATVKLVLFSFVFDKGIIWFSS